MSAVPKVGGGREPFAGHSGTHAAPGDLPSGCRFNPRCEHRLPVCLDGPPPLVESVADMPTAASAVTN
jgi:oligopeptide/dipeptide ABC transporter ATP-binding protein